jgi:polyisoprenoid-binding protein YceI
MTTQTAETAVKTWAIDPSHSIAEFAVKHMMVSTVKGRFATLEGAAEIDEANPLASSVRATIDVASITTNDAQRDAHLRSDDFFAAEKYPSITFISNRVERVDAENYRIVGDLTIRDVTKEVVLDTEFEGQVRDPYGNQRAGFTATTQINRGDFGVSFNGVLETGGLIVSDKVKITLHIEAVRPA